ncbi:MAG: sugar ABC transporter substrate-binding protein [Christensenellales bacterium]
MKKSISLIACIATAIFIAGCSAGNSISNNATTPTAAPQSVEFIGVEEKERAGLIMLAMPILTHPVHKTVQLGFVEAARELGYDTEIVGSDTAYGPDFITAVESALSRQPDGIIIWGDDASHELIKKCKAQGVYTVAPHFLHSKTDIPELDANLLSNPSAYGAACADEMAAALKGRSGSIAITQGSYNIEENAAANAFSKRLKQIAPQLSVLDPLPENFDVSSATSDCTTIIKANQDLIGVFGTSGNSAAAWALAVSASGLSKGQLIIIATDYTDQSISLLSGGDIHAIVARPLYEAGEASVSILDRLINGIEAPYLVELPAPIVTSSGVERYSDIIKRADAL